MSIVDIPLERFYSDSKIIEELYFETPINAPSDEEFLNLPVNEDYKNNPERLEREEKYRLEKEANIKENNAKNRDRSITIDDVDELVQQFSSTPIITHSQR